ncbi:NYN domain-containing protein [Candidatus Dojkabacteria bacterium]|nr:NYN domain-containing protein [Candidatus Dojkabacteria bacterium]
MRKRDTIYAFIDSQNLNYSIQKDIITRERIVYTGWKIDMNLFYKYLQNKFRAERIFLFIGYLPENRAMYSSFQKFGYELIFKPTVKDINGKVKGNVDAEIVLHSVRLKYDEFDKAIFVSGDGDFYCLYEFFEGENKLKSIVIPNQLAQSSLLKRFDDYKIFIQREKKKLIYKGGRRRTVPRR